MGSTVSAIVTSVVQVSVSPAASSTVRVTVTVSPILLQSKIFGDTERIKSSSAVQLSVDPSLISAPVRVRFPLASNSAV